MLLKKTAVKKKTVAKSGPEDENSPGTSRKVRGRVLLSLEKSKV